MAPHRELTRNEALDELLSHFTRLGLRDEGEARRIVDALASGKALDPTALARLIPRSFLVNSNVERYEIARAIEIALSNVRMRVEENRNHGDVIVKNQRIVINDSGNFGGVVGGGTVSQVTQSQRLSSKTLTQWMSECLTDPAVREILDSPIATDEKRSRLQKLLEGTKDFAADVTAKVIAGLLPTGK